MMIGLRVNCRDQGYFAGIAMLGLHISMCEKIAMGLLHHTGVRC